jgi:hypothetical protein
MTSWVVPRAPPAPPDAEPPLCVLLTNFNLAIYELFSREFLIFIVLGMKDITFQQDCIIKVPWAGKYFRLHWKIMQFKGKHK